MNSGTYLPACSFPRVNYNTTTALSDDKEVGV